MTKLLSTLILAAVAMIGFNAQAASHTGAAPMKASEPAKTAAAEPAKKASGAAKAKKAKKAKKAASAA